MTRQRVDLEVEATFTVDGVIKPHDIRQDTPHYENSADAEILPADDKLFRPDRTHGINRRQRTANLF